MSPYSIACSTCGARLKVRDARAIGELSLCPKCGSMVMITPPTPGGSDASLAPREHSDSSQQIIVRRPSVASEFEDAAALFADTVDDLSRAPKANGAGASGTGVSGTGVSPVTTSPSKSTIAKQKKTEAITGETPVPLAKAPLAAAPAAPPPLAPPTESMSSIELDPLVARGPAPSPLAQASAGLEQTFDLAPATSPQPVAMSQVTSVPTAHTGLAGMPPPVVDDRPWTSPTQQLLRRYALIGGAVAAAIVVVAVLLTIIFRHPVQPATASTTGDNAAANDKNIKPIPVKSLDPPIDQSPADPPDVDNPPVDEPPEEPPAETVDDPPPADETTDDAPPIFGESDPPADPADGDPAAETVADAGLGEFAPLIDAFPIPDEPEGDPAAEEPDAPPDAAPEAPPKRERPEPLAVDVRARLADPIDGIDAGGAPLVKFLELISQLSTIPITLPPESLAQAQATATSPVSLVLRDANVEKILEAGLAEHGLKFEIRGEQIVVVPAPKRGTGLVSVGLAVEDLAPDAAALESLAAQLRTFVAPDAWDTAGGKSQINISSGKLEIRAPQAVQFDAHIFCQKLRLARGLEARSKLPRPLYDLPSRSHQLAEKLAQPVRAVFHAERPLTRILNHLEDAAEVTLLVDWEALIAEGWPPHTKTAFVIDNQPLATALDELLTPLDLAYRAIDAGTVQITSRAALASRPELEIYSIAPQIDGGAAPAKVIADLKAKLGKELFVEDGGAGEIGFDAASNCLIVRLPQAQQRVVEGELTPET